MKKEFSPASGANPAQIKAILLLTSFIAMLNETSINVCLGQLMGVFGVSVSTAQWLVAGFMLVMAVVVPATAFILQSFTTRRVYFSGLLLLVVGSVLAAAAPSFGVLLIGRLVQAAGTCCLMTLTVTTVIQLTPPQARGGAMGLVSLVSLFAPAIAPSLAGAALERLGWRAVFFGPLPLFLVLGAFSYFKLKNLAEPRRQRLDILSVVLSLVGFGGLLYAVSSLDRFSSEPVQAAASLAAGIAALAFFAVRQLRLEEPLLDLRVFRFPNFALAMGSIFFCILTAFGVTMLTPLFLAQLLGLGAAAAGLSMLPGGLLNGFTAPLFGKLYDRFGPRAILLAGSLLLPASLAVLSLLGAGTPLGVYIAVHCACLLALSMVMTVSQVNGINELPPRLFPHGTAVMSTLMQLGGGFGSALYVALLSSAGKAHAEAGFHRAFLGGALLFLLPLAAAFFVRRSVHKEEPAAEASPRDAASA